MDIILESVVGSRAHGTATPLSDVDKKGIFLAPLEEYLSLSWTAHDDTVSSESPGGGDDYVYYEIKKALSIILKGSPAMNEVLWSGFCLSSEIGDLVIENRSLLVPRTVSRSYVGMITGYLSSLRDDNTSKDKKEKSGIRAMYYADRGLELVSTGNLTVRCSDEEISKYRELALDYSQVFKYTDERITNMYDCTTSPLPEVGSRDVATSILLHARLG